MVPGQVEAPAVNQIAAWQEGLVALHGRVAARFARPEVRARAGRYLAGLLAPVERRNGWQLAEQIGERAPDGVQRLLRTARCDAEAVRDDLRAYVVEHLGGPGAVLVVDETGFPKKGTKSVGVARQDCGPLGKVANCQVGVFLAYASPRGRAFLDRELYLPEAWAADASRRREAGVPEDVAFQTKPELARAMLARALEAGVPARWVAGDEVYGGDRRLRVWLEERGVAHVLAVKSSEPLWAATERGPAQVPAAALAAALPARAWRRLSAGDGAKGPRLDNWARVPLRPLGEPGKGYWLLARRGLAEPHELAYFVCFGPERTPLRELVRVAGTRWAVEEGFERAKEVGLDQYEVRHWGGWYRHVTLCLLAHAYLEVTRAAANAEAEKGAPAPT